jgi:indole-3-glycerol phosphate synthase
MILDSIVAARRQDLAQAKRQVSLADLEGRPPYGAPRRGFTNQLTRHSPAIIAEVKKASPSCGLIRADFDPVAIARSYDDGGAAAISVLTEERSFQGRLDYLEAIRAAVELPLLRKDFLVDPYQVVEARAWGADAVILIVAILDDGMLGELLAAATETGLDALVEVHTEGEVERAASAGARLIGVNNRNLHTFETTLDTSLGLRPLLPDGATAVAESGIATAADLDRLDAGGFDAFLIGESLMRAPDPGAQLRELIRATNSGRRKDA